MLFSYETIVLWGIIVPFAQFWSPPTPEGNIWLPAAQCWLYSQAHFQLHLLSAFLSWWASQCVLSESFGMPPENI